MFQKILRRLFLKKKEVDNSIFQLCYKWTVWKLAVFSFIVTCRLFLGDSFECIISTDTTPSSYMETKCYADTVFSLPVQEMYTKGSPVIRLGSEYKRYQTFYSWVNLFLLLQAFNFYLPHLFWKSYELGYTKYLSSGIKDGFSFDEKTYKELCYLTSYILNTLGKYKMYTSLYIFFEVCNCVISITQIYCLITFFDITGIPDGLPISLTTWSDFQKFYFPPSGNCLATKISATGNVTKFNAVCILPLNQLYMMLYLYLLVWYVLLSILCAIVLIYRVALLVRKLRVKVIQILVPLAEKETIEVLFYGLSYSDFIFLTRLRKTMTDVDFTQMLEKIYITYKCTQRDENEDHQSLPPAEVHNQVNSSSRASTRSVASQHKSVRKQSRIL
ncbi:innexin inx2-like [Stegodyphus dumicola]|uniref:innexin inx2-like n=1 Tax=Stegodyphus dumicola TaxID=202533 RepID=UPI0015B1E294|nr:innexin inx2-like [Stegodyphus dumicola]